MRYLFFDIECANCFGGTGKICEFGYVVTDSEFNIIQKEEILINPKSDFDWFVLKNMLAYSKKDYKVAYEYWYYYDKIKSLLENKDTIIIGHTTDADAKYLADESKRYSLPFINFEFVDCKWIDRQISGRKRGLGVDALIEEYHIEQQLCEHKACDDAEATMQILKTICVKENMSIDQIIDKCDKSHGSVEEGNVQTASKTMSQSTGSGNGKNKIKGKNYIKFHQFLDGVKPQGEIIQSSLMGKSVTISINYEIEHFTQMLSIIQLLTNHGAIYKKKATLCDIFVKCNILNESGEEKYCTKLNYVNEANENGSNIEIITFDKLLELLNTSVEQIENMPAPSEDSFLVKESINKKVKQRKNKDYIESDVTYSLGEMFKMKGVKIS